MLHSSKFRDKSNTDPNINLILSVFVSKMRLYIYVMKSTGGKLQRTQVQFNVNKHKTKELCGMNLDQDLNMETLHKYGQT